MCKQYLLKNITKFGLAFCIDDIVLCPFPPHPRSPTTPVLNVLFFTWPNVLEILIPDIITSNEIIIEEKK